MWDERYGKEEEFAYGTEPNDFLKETITSAGSSNDKKKKCLLLADGEGRNGVFMAEQGFNVVSVDFSETGLKKAQALAKSRGVTIETVVADLASYDLGTEQWDCIVGIFCHLPPPVRAKVLEGIPDSLKEGGQFLLECYTPDQLQYKTGGPPTADFMFSKQLLDEALGTKLQVIRNEEVVRTVTEGKLHTGKAAVVQFIGKK
ncbi:Methyltransferase domain [Seminavis robusta]|uniref:Methyltransferase domain n=1 Tax=Seminavis robusta TaxID=568900 RepID=A0A9N8E9L7_9STRA|nr:Methyltransferase domain [Seminavis robusta]|eukprot:Sro808_g205510.1 Methyltransferase domain (202) ;mRNA; r:44045-44650